jgi:glycosyltransferase involved in cell wall biosynthesis
LSSERIRVLSLIEAQVVTSPARIVLRFAADCRDSMDLRVVNFVRGSGTAEGYRNALLEEAARNQIPASVVPDAAPYDVSLLAKLKALIREHQPHIVQTNSIKSHFLVSLAGARDYGWLAFHHGYTAENFKMRLYNALDRWSLRACDEVVTVCNAFADELKAKGIRREKIRVIPNSIPADFLVRDERVAEEWRARLGVEAGEKVIVSAGRLSPEKGHRYLVEAAARLMRSTESVPRFKVLIAGSGLLEQELQQQIANLGLVGQVKLIGFHADIRPLYQMADVFVLPSLSEGSPMVLLESMIARVPVVTTRVGGIPETISDGETGLLVPAADPEALAAALSRLLNSPKLASELMEAAYRRAQESYSPQLYNTRVLAAFEEVLERKQKLRAERVEVPQ